MRRKIAPGEFGGSGAIKKVVYACILTGGKEDVNAMTGRIKFYNRKEGYGFIAGDDGSNYYLSYKNIPTSLQGIDEGCSVEFTPCLDDGGYFAEDLKIV